MKNLFELSNQLFHLSITKEMDELRNQYCPSKGSFQCDCQCVIYKNFYHKGFSCNHAISAFPADCKQLISAELNKAKTP